MSKKNNEKPKKIEKLGEFGLIHHLTKDIKIKNKSTKYGIGDDAAVLKNEKENTVISTDMLIEGIHFDLMYHPLKHLGYKSVVVNLSDIIAMNAIPSQITVSIAISNRFNTEAVDELYKGILKACEFYNIDLVGGDTTSSLSGLTISITAIGQADSDKIIYRNNAKPGDLLCVSGDLGAAYLGLQLLEREKKVFLEEPDLQPDLEDQNYVIGRILKPEARIDIIRQFDQKNILPNSMIDISDGLASEIYHICDQSGTGAVIEESNIPISKESQELAFKFRTDPTIAALNGGEDYELLFTVNKAYHKDIMQMPDVTIIGEITDKSEGIMLHTKGGKIHTIKAQGWQHF